MELQQGFKKIVEHIFNNWTALQLAVEHSMGGPNSKQIALDTVDYLVNYLTGESNIETEDIEDVLDDIMDQEFNTVCEDNSIKEISFLLYRFLQLLKEGNVTQAEIEYNNLPVGSQWLSQSQEQPPVPPINEQEPPPTTDEGTTIAAPMEQVDSEWTQVKSRKKR